jgi:hypothetical protein
VVVIVYTHHEREKKLNAGGGFYGTSVTVFVKLVYIPCSPDSLFHSMCFHSHLRCSAGMQCYPLNSACNCMVEEF